MPNNPHDQRFSEADHVSRNHDHTMTVARASNLMPVQGDACSRAMRAATLSHIARYHTSPPQSVCQRNNSGRQHHCMPHEESMPEAVPPLGGSARKTQPTGEVDASKKSKTQSRPLVCSPHLRGN